jgi:hypothetical protein
MGEIRNSVLDGKAEIKKRRGNDTDESIILKVGCDCVDWIKVAQFL